nr:retrotransposon protein, putative, Ty1-copia subclass [Tanacetum cinerariifolium]
YSPAHAADSAANVLAESKAIYDAHNKVACLMLGSITSELHRQFENYSPYEMIQEHRSIFEKQARMKSTKRVKHNLDSTYLWHCRLAHISKKRIEKLQQEGLLKSTYVELFDQCVSCLSGKMTRKSFPYHPERATDLPGIIHTDVCGPLRHVSRQGASYFITFTDDNSRYGYVYLFKHKYEDYTLESATRILNMVPTKKVDKIPYELWYGKVPNLSYLKVWGCEALVKRDTPEKLKQRSVKCIFIGYPKETMDLEEIQDEDTSPSKITSEIPMEVEGFEPPQEEVIPVRRSERTHQAPTRLCLNVETEKHSLGDFNEPTSYKATMLDSKSKSRSML